MFDDSSSQLPHAAFLSSRVFMMQPTKDRLSPDFTSLGNRCRFIVLDRGRGPYPY
jgi:hypothetical protein